MIPGRKDLPVPRVTPVTPGRRGQRGIKATRATPGCKARRVTPGPPERRLRCPVLREQREPQARLDLQALLDLLAPSDKWARRVSSAPSALRVLWVLRAELARLERKARLVSPDSLERLVLLELQAPPAARVRLA